MMVSSNIPLHKVDTPSFRNFLEKYTTHPIPTESTLTFIALASYRLGRQPPNVAFNLFIQ